MKTLRIADQEYPCEKHETVLDALLRAGVAVPHVCKLGSCQTCLVRSVRTMPPPESQIGLRDTLKKQRYFLACRCQPSEDMQINLANQADFYRKGVVVKNEMLNHNTFLLAIQFAEAFECYAGQFVNLQRQDGLTRSYSIAHISQQSHTLEFHIRRLPNGQFSEWLHEKLAMGEKIAVSEPHGHCFYTPERCEQNLLLIGTGTGLAPLEGILRDALQHQHQGEIHLFHGSRDVADLYRIEEMQALAAKYPQFFYTPCLSGTSTPNGFTKGRAHEVALKKLADLKNWRVFLCGHPDMVNQAKRQSFLKGAAVNDIYADAFYAAS